MKKVIEFIKDRKAVILSFSSIFIMCLIALVFGTDNTFQVVDVKAIKLKSSGLIANDAKFTVETKGVLTDDIEKHIYLEPALDYEIKEKGYHKYEITLKEDIGYNQIFNISYVENEIVENKWAFQTEPILNINNIYPRDEASHVSEYSVINIFFSYPVSLNDVKEHFEITPNVNGTITKIKGEEGGFRFSPSEPYAKETKYTIKITKGIKYENKVLEEDFVSTFSTGIKYEDKVEYNVNYITEDKINTFTSSDKPKIKLERVGEDAKDVDAIEVFKISDSSNYIKYLNGEKVKMESLGNRKFTKTKSGPEDLYILNTPLNEGYYVFYLKNNKTTLVKSNVQVNDLEAYAMQSERDVLLWVAKNGELAENIEITYKNNKYQTNENGIAQLNEVFNSSQKIDYLLIHGTTDLVIGFVNNNRVNAPSGYIYIDRPLYKNTDTINIWGYIPLDFFADKPDLNDFKLEFDGKKYDIKVNENGSFITKIELKNHADESYTYIHLSYKNVSIAHRYFEIKNYANQNYVFELDSDKNFVIAGKPIELNIKASHITGLAAANKDIIISKSGKNYYEKTDLHGNINIQLETTKERYESYSYPLSYETVTVQSGGQEYNYHEKTKSFYIVDSDIYINEYKTTVENNHLKLYADKLNFSKVDNISYNLDNVPKIGYTGPAELEIIEKKYTRTITGTRYNEYTKENINIYHTSSSENVIKSIEVQINNGVLDVDLFNNFKSATENTSYSYSYKVSIYSNENYMTNKRQYHYEDYKTPEIDDETPNETIDYEYTNAIETILSEEYSNDFYSGFNISYDYYLYEYALGNDNDYYKKYSINEKINFYLTAVAGKTENKGKILQITHKERILDNILIDKNDLSYTYTEKDYPGSNITAAYFLNGKFYRMPSNYYDYNELDSLLTVSVETNKKTYKPKDNVTGKIVVKDKDGNPVNGIVNVSVVNEAVFGDEHDHTDILESIYSNKRYNGYTFTTYRNYNLYIDLGGTGGDDGEDYRTDFGDTIYFDTLNVKDGIANFNFKLNDELTKFRITVHAVTEKNQAGVGKSNFVSVLPLSVNSIKPTNVKSTDDLVINASAIKAPKSNIKYEISIDEIDKKISLDGKLNESVYANFGKLNPGEYTVKITAKSGSDKDSLSYKVKIIETAHEIAIKNVKNISKKHIIKPTKNPVIIELYNENLKDYQNLITHLKSHLSDRLDTQIAYYKAIELENKIYKNDVIFEKPNLKNYASGSKLRVNINSSEDNILTALGHYYANEYFELNVDSMYFSTSNYIESLLVKAAFKKPILSELNEAAKRKNLDDKGRLIIGIAYAFLGDYNNAKKLYNIEPSVKLSGSTLELKAILATFVDKDNAKELIYNCFETNEESQYINFAILSFFKNNQADVFKEEIVEIKSKEINKKVKLNGLEIEKITVYDEDLSSLTFKTKSKNIVATYYYQGKINETDYKKAMKISLEGDLKANSVVRLKIDISKLENKNGELSIALPNSLRLDNNFENEKGLYVSRKTNEYIILSLSKYYISNTIEIPLYVTNPGSYEMEPVVFMSRGNYYISNKIDFNIE